MRRLASLSLVLIIGALACTGCKETPPANDPDAPGSGGEVDAPMVDGPPAQKMTFFITSTGLATGGDFRRTVADTDGLAGADEFCRTLAEAADSTLGTLAWRAYLSTSTVNAKDRIGAGPWYNQKLVMVAGSVADLLDATKNKIGEETGLDEKGMMVPIRNPNQHDILTGTLENGLAAPTTCANWTSSDAGTAMVGHFNRMGGGNSPTSWSSAHNTNGCSAGAFRGTGGRGSIYCFVAN
ncbi:MAG: hypothetical protein R3B48_12635 [Kofleriaceae bacterium]